MSLQAMVDGSKFMSTRSVLLLVNGELRPTLMRYILSRRVRDASGFVVVAFDAIVTASETRSCTIR